jgi:hypothetical protein
VIATAAVVVVGLALIPLAVAQEGSGRRNGFTQFALTSRIGEMGLGFVASEEPAPFSASRTIDALQLGALIGGATLAIVAIGLLAARASPEERRAASVALVIGGGAIAVPLLLAVGGLDFINPRNLVGALVPLLVFLAIGLGIRGGGWMAWLASGATCLLFAAVLVAVNVSAQMQRPDWRGAAEALESSGGAQLLVVPRNGDDPLAYYLGAEKPRHIERVRTAEIEVLSTNYHVKRPPGPFKLVSKEGMAPVFVLWRYRAHRPQSVRLRDVSGSKVLSERSSVLVRGTS